MIQSVIRREVPRTGSQARPRIGNVVTVTRGSVRSFWGKQEPTAAEVRETS
ncbi:MAG: hypothetical protein BJ554DRAFT_7333, partial [Olpidium bornovanus]